MPKGTFFLFLVQCSNRAVLILLGVGMGGGRRPFLAPDFSSSTASLILPSLFEIHSLKKAKILLNHGEWENCTFFFVKKV